jgi:hypothetical protein
MVFNQKCVICKRKFQSRQRIRQVCSSPQCLRKFNSIKAIERNRRQVGRTYEEQFGSERAKKLKALRRKNIIGERNPSFGGIKPEQRLKMSFAKLGKTYEEIHGIQAARALKEVRRKQFLKKNPNLKRKKNK